jgi:alginate O-acetyltransferase complex protein AlgJ
MAESREQIAQREVGHTDIPPWLSRVLVAVFLVTIAVVPALQTVHDIRQGRAGDRASAVPQAVDALRLPLVGLRAMSTAEGGPMARLFAANRETLRSINSFEDALEKRSLVGEWLRPRLQEPLTRILGVGNEQVYRGRSRWLFYRPAVDHLTGPGFLDQHQLARRAAAGSEWQEPPQPDPVPAILEFHQQLAERGIELLIVPVPVKATIHPEMLSRRYATTGRAVHNPSRDAFRARLEAEGVRVFDPAPLLVEAAVSSGEPQYLTADTHWTPQAADLVARELATAVQEMIDLASETTVRYTNREASASNTGDLAEMLEVSTLFPAQTVHTGMVEEPGGNPWRAARTAEVLLLGDSFANIYHQEQLGWGTGAGLVQRLSYHLRRPVGAMIRNDDGAFSTRLMLSEAITGGSDRLANTRVVIWEFTARELSVGDWRSIPMAPIAREDTGFVVPQRGATVVVEGTVAVLAEVPDPRTAPYADYIVGMHMVDLVSDQALDGDQAMVFTWAMRGRRLTAGAHYRVGQRLTLELRPWADMTRELGTITRGELFEDDLFLQTPCWGDEVKP